MSIHILIPQKLNTWSLQQKITLMKKLPSNIYILPKTQLQIILLK